MKTTTNNKGATCVTDPYDPNPLTQFVTLTGHWCTICHLPRTPIPGQGDTHPNCTENPHAE